MPLGLRNVTNAFHMCHRPVILHAMVAGWSTESESGGLVTRRSCREGNVVRNAASHKVFFSRVCSRDSGGECRVRRVDSSVLCQTLSLFDVSMRRDAAVIDVGELVRIFFFADLEGVDVHRDLDRSALLP